MQASQTPTMTAAEIDAMHQRMQRLETLASLGELTGTATHEFNNVLMTIMNYAKLGLRNQDAASREKALQKILEASQRAAQISNTILAQARNRADGQEPTDLAGLIRDTLVLMGRELQKYRISVELDLPENLPSLSLSGNSIVRLLINLMTNARQAMDQGGTLAIRLATADIEGAPAVELSLRDSGRGIAPELLSKIFEPFFSTKAGPDETGKGGTGLGLAACKQIVDDHGGRIRVQSTVGRGTAFVITLPVPTVQRAVA